MDTKLINILKKDGVAIIPTDTIYGIVGSALNPQVVEKIYSLRKRMPNKPFIILISSLDDLEKFDIELTQKQKEFLEKNWPNPVSVVLPIQSEKFKYLHRATNSLAFRMPKKKKLLDLLKQTGPLVAPSANWEGQKPSETIEEAKKYFGDRIDFYVDGGIIKSQPSTLLQLNVDGSKKILRKGTFKIE